MLDGTTPITEPAIPLKPLRIGSVALDAPVILAPMAGVTDQPYRELCFTLGTRLAIGEMLTADTQLWSSRKSRLRLVAGSAAKLKMAYPSLG